MVTFHDAKEVSATIARTCNPLAISLFGSVARDESGADLDLLIVVDDDKREGAVDVELYQCLKPFYRRFDIDPFVIPVSRLREYAAKGSPFLGLIMREGRLLYMRGIVSEWAHQAAEELKMAEYLLGGGFFKGACYHAQQAIEKGVKAKLLGKGWELQKTHSLERMRAIADEYGLSLDITDEETVFVDSIYRGRYPAESGLLPMGEPTQEDAGRAVDLARRIVAE